MNKEQIEKAEKFLEKLDILRSINKDGGLFIENGSRYVNAVKHIYYSSTMSKEFRELYNDILSNIETIHILSKYKTKENISLSNICNDICEKFNYSNSDCIIHLADSENEEDDKKFFQAFLEEAKKFFQAFLDNKIEAVGVDDDGEILNIFIR